ncbi:hypothetical protein [Nannocystis punicea]|uniref:Uncharacterized protein n=1 Tax=Nannocystis punicea TaxID=2995304 RepID=A0ABY7GUL9_9BACT|nr:hypothetical protein [Nannocystis poenicansa]WAS90657.1 hypothetical protein O0S08_31100 [Nannocystis poenicansa]
MSRVIIRSLLLAVVLAGTACPLAPEYVGATLTTGGSGMSVDTLGDSEPTSLDPGMSVTTDGGVSSTSMDPALTPYGSSCELVGLGADIVFTALSLQPLCEGGICLLVHDVPAPQCEEDAECAAQTEGSVCEQHGLCTVPSAFVEANSRCTQTCATDEDCPDIPGCATGVSCTIFINIGDLCCQRVCGCNDHRYPPYEESMEDICAKYPEQCQ